MDERKLLELGRAVYAKLSVHGEWPKVLTFELYDENRRLDIADIGKRLSHSHADPECEVVSVDLPDRFRW